MINYYKVYGLVWMGILVLYILGWSDLAKPLDIGIIIFLIIMICASLLFSIHLAKIFKKCKFDIIAEKEKNSPLDMHKYYLLFVYFIASFLYGKCIPLIKVLQGVSYGDVDFRALPFITVIMHAIALLESFELSYRFFYFRDKKALAVNLGILFYYILMVERQNILVVLMFFIISWYMSSLRKKVLWNCQTIIKAIIIHCLLLKEKSSGSRGASLPLRGAGAEPLLEFRGKAPKRSTGRKCLKLWTVIIITLTILYGFGIVGNMRYGSMWHWNDASMIMRLGKANDKFPDIVPDSYFWSYLYAISPLSNLNNNVMIGRISGSMGGFIYELLPQIITNKFDLNREYAFLEVASLTATTGYTRMYNASGYFGVYFILILEFSACYFITINTLKRNRSIFIPQLYGVTYFLMLSVFSNPFSYPITGVMLYILLLKSVGLKSSKKSIR